jgi:hypothetical protein
MTDQYEVPHEIQSNAVEMDDEGYVMRFDAMVDRMHHERHIYVPETMLEAADAKCGQLEAENKRLRFLLQELIEFIEAWCSNSQCRDGQPTLGHWLQDVKEALLDAT